MKAADQVEVSSGGRLENTKEQPLSGHVDLIAQ